MESNAEFCAEVAEKVMGWKYAGICRRGPVYDACLLVRGHAVNQIEVGVDFRPDIDANDDYLVLEHVRTTWDYNLGERADGSHGKDIIGFSEALRHVSVDVDRHKMSDGRTLPSSDFTWTSLIQYVPGDYSRAALQALKEQSNDT